MEEAKPLTAKNAKNTRKGRKEQLEITRLTQISTGLCAFHPVN
jgi:hypothetical protein